jgi:hypothetical protein
MTSEDAKNVVSFGIEETFNRIGVVRAAIHSVGLLFCRIVGSSLQTTTLMSRALCHLNCKGCPYRFLIRQ